MVYTTLSLDDFLGMECTPNMTRMDYLLAVSEVSWFKSLIGEEDNLIAEQKEEYCIKKEERITQNIKSVLSSFPEVLDHRQEKSVLDNLIIPRGKRSMPNARPRKVTDQFLCNGDESMIKKAVENNSEEVVKADNGKNIRIKINLGAIANLVVGGKTPIGVRNQEFRFLKNSEKRDNEENRVNTVADHSGNRVSKINYTARFAPLPIKKRLQEVAYNAFGFNNQEFFENRVKASDDRERRVPKINCMANVASLPIKKRPREVSYNALAFNDQELVKKPAAKRNKKRNIAVKAAEALPVIIINRELRTNFKDKITNIGGSVESVKLVIEKKLFDTDVRSAEGRLSIPQTQIINKFLKPEEEELLNMRNGTRVCGMNVTLIKPSLLEGVINLKKWTMNKAKGNASASYVLTTYWNEVVDDNGLKIGMKVQLWAFRKDEKLCFALVKV
ncbi:hypothetical protein CQW23_16454 [Capsicum baccatum]|uniref:TF-B3 domain-containing protein n=1 Tax=Capsicum baccatum TaxID=33114 RepID=A0A2G2WB78_CAPBA|nr:hypothetical protein CQW23_16454 [Capsicum baccatum]